MTDPAFDSRLGHLPSHWIRTRFGQDVVINEGQVDPTSEPWSSMVLVAPNHIESGTGRIISLETARDQGADSGKYRAKSGQVLYSKIRPALNKVAIAPVDCLCSADMYPISGRHHAVDNRFLAYWMLARPFVAYATLMSDRVKMPKVNREEVAAAPWTRPPLDEQRRIADFLDVETSRIDRLASAIADGANLLQARRQALLMSAFPRQRSGVRLGYFLDLVTSGPRGWGDYVGDEGTPFFRSANLRRDTIDSNLDDLALVDPPLSAAAEAARSRVRAGDVLVGITGANTGWVSLADGRIDRANVSQHVCLVRPGKRVEGRWLAYALSAPQVQELLLGSQYGGTKTQLSLGDIRDLVIPLPPIDEQGRIVADISEGLAAITAEHALRQKQRAVLAERRQALITAAVTGGITV